MAFKLFNKGEKSDKANGKSRAWKIVKRVIFSVLGTVLALVILILSTFMFIFYSPWTHELRDQYILMTYMTSNPWLCTWFFSQEKIDEVFANNGSAQPDEPVDTTLITPTPSPKPTPTPSEDPNTSTSDDSSTPETSQSDPEPVIPPKPFKTSEKYQGEAIYDDGEVQILQFSGENPVGGKYTARLIQIKDPSRVFLGLTKGVGGDGNPGYGQTVTSMLATNDALCGINAGGFVDINGVGSGGVPLGAIIKDGVYKVYTEEENHTIIGFNKDNILVMGQFSEEQIKEQGIRDGMSWRQPALLILNGVNVEQYGLAGGYDPRSAIGQCADGTVLLLVVDGSSLRGIDGANFAMMADILSEFGAVNAANLDGGTSASMALKDRLINKVCNPSIADRGRDIATAWLVKNVQE